MLLSAIIVLATLLGLYLSLFKPNLFLTFYLFYAIPVARDFMGVYGRATTGEMTLGVSVGPFNVDVYVPILIATSAGIFWHIYANQRGNRLHKAAAIFVFVMLLVGAFKIVDSYLQGYSVVSILGDFSRKYNIYFVALWCLVALPLDKKVLLVSVRNGVFFMVVAEIIFSMLMLFWIGGIDSAGVTKRFGTADGALVLLLGGIGMLSLWVGKERRNWHVVLGGICLVMVLLADHRSVWLAGVVCVMAYSAFNMLGLWGRSTIVARVLIPALGVMAMLLFFALVSTNLADSVLGQERGQILRTRANAIINPEEDGTAKWRMERWDMIIERVDSENKGWVGFDIGEYSKMTASEMGYTAVAHNAYVDQYSRFGLLGCILYLGFFFICVRNVLLQIKHGNLDPMSLAYLRCILMVMVAGHAYALAYGFEGTVIVFMCLGALYTSTPVQNVVLQRKRV